MQKTNNEMLNKYYELGDAINKLASIQPLIQIDVDTTLDAANKIDDTNKKLRFLGHQYLNLVESLKKAGIIN